MKISTSLANLSMGTWFLFNFFLKLVTNLVIVYPYLFIYKICVYFLLIQRR